MCNTASDTLRRHDFGEHPMIEPGRRALRTWGGHGVGGRSPALPDAFALRIPSL